MQFALLSIQTNCTERTFSWTFIIALSRARWRPAHDQERESAICVQLLPFPHHALSCKYVRHHAADPVVSATRGNHHILLQVLVHSHPEDCLDLAERAGLPGHLGHPSVAASSAE